MLRLWLKVRGSHTVNFGDFMIPRYEAAGAKGGTGNINGTVTVSNFVNNGAPFLYGTNVYFDRDAKAFTNTIEVLSKARKDLVSPVHLVATAGNKFSNTGAGGFNREPVWRYVLPINVVRSQAYVYAAEGKLDFTWKLKHGLKVMVR